LFNNTNKIAIILSHPVQYYSPLFKVISTRGKLKIKVFYTWELGSQTFDKGFGKKVEWDIPLLDGYDYNYVSNNGIFGRRFWHIRNPSLIKEIEEWGATAIMVFEWSYYSHLKAMIHFHNKNITVLFRGDSHILDKQHWFKEYFRKFYLSWVYKHVDYALYVGKNNKDYYKNVNLKEPQLIFVPHAIDNERFLDSKDKQYLEKAIVWRKKIGFKDNNIVLSFIGKFEDKKNPLLLIKALRKIGNPNLKLLMVGNGNLENEIRIEADKDECIKILGFQNQSTMPILYRVADIFVLPSKGPGETWGLAVNEAMACGLPIIVSNKVGCAIDLVKDNENGFIFESDNLESLVNKIEKFIIDPGIIKAFENRSQEIIKEWSFLNISLALENLVNHKQDLNKD